MTADGKRVLIFQYRYGKLVRRHRIGVWGSSGLTATRARREAERLRGLVRAGRDPVAENREAQAQAAVAEQAGRAANAEEAFTFGKLVDGWETRGIAHRRPSYIGDATSRLRSYFASWSKRPAASITRAEVIQAIDRVEHERGTTSARRAIAYARAAYGWAEKRNMLDTNPFRGIAAPGKENPRDRVLTTAELGAIWRGAGLIDPMQGAFVRMLLLTLQRLEEVAGMRWSELSDDRSIWTIPSERAKMGKAHTIHLSPAARDLFQGLPALKGSPFVFVTRRRGRIGGFSHIKRELVQAMQPDREEWAGAAKAGRPRPPVKADWRFHDFRRAGVTTLANLGIPPHVADKLLNHVTGTIRGVAAVYQRAEFLPERKRAIEAWAAHVLSCAGEESGSNVVNLRSAG